MKRRFDGFSSDDLIGVWKEEIKVREPFQKSATEKYGSA